ncbi:MAG: hypothetical protein K2M87_04065 [Muribaculaceae bacterium]|nr:hypothetical protein [Muribaculaceae bacterium]
MKKIITLLLAAMTILPVSMQAHNNVQVNISCNPGIEDMVNHIVYYPNGYYDYYGHFHKVIGHSHHHGIKRCKICEKQYKAYLHSHKHAVHKHKNSIKHAAKRCCKAHHHHAGIKYKKHHSR